MQQRASVAYDKRRHGRLRQGHGVRPRAFHTGLDVRTSSRVPENHDEPRATAAFPAGITRRRDRLSLAGPAVLSPGQLGGVSISAPRARPVEPVDIAALRLLAVRFAARRP
jgi:hypothetical protein